VRGKRRGQKVTSAVNASKKKRKSGPAQEERKNRQSHSPVTSPGPLKGEEKRGAASGDGKKIAQTYQKNPAFGKKGAPAVDGKRRKKRKRGKVRKSRGTQRGRYPGGGTPGHRRAPASKRKEGKKRRGKRRGCWKKRRRKGDRGPVPKTPPISSPEKKRPYRNSKKEGKRVCCSHGKKKAHPVAALKKKSRSTREGSCARREGAHRLHPSITKKTVAGKKELFEEKRGKERTTRGGSSPVHRGSSFGEKRKKDKGTKLKRSLTLSSLAGKGIVPLEKGNSRLGQEKKKKKRRSLRS